jgi:hypothetical protein
VKKGNKRVVHIAVVFFSSLLGLKKIEANIVINSIDRDVRHGKMYCTTTARRSDGAKKKKEFRSCVRARQT